MDLYYSTTSTLRLRWGQPGLEDKEHLQQLDETTKEFAVLETQVRRYKGQLEKLKPLVESGCLEQGNIDKLLKDALVEPRVNVMKHNFYNKFCGRAGIELAVDGDEGMFIQESESMKSTICPVTQMEMEDPLRNASCGHTYSKKGIQAYLKRTSSSKQCPDGGCRRELSFDKLERDVEMEVIIDHSHRISEQQRSQAAAQNDENDAEEYVVE